MPWVWDSSLSFRFFLLFFPFSITVALHHCSQVTLSFLLQLMSSDSSCFTQSISSCCSVFFSDCPVVGYLHEPRFLLCSVSFICLPNIRYFSCLDIPHSPVLCFPHYSSSRGFSTHYLKMQSQTMVFLFSACPKYPLSLRSLKSLNLTFIVKNGQGRRMIY